MMLVILLADRLSKMFGPQNSDLDMFSSKKGALNVAVMLT